MSSTAVVFGLNYTRSGVSPLYGCINDARLMYDCLVEAKLYESIRMFTDESDERSTTKAGILGILSGLARDKGLRRVFFYFAGHGAQVTDGDGDEEDGRDEVLLPSDYWDSEGKPDRTRLVLDDEICRVLSEFAPTTTVTAVFDCCHSGTVCDLAYLWDLSTEGSHRSPVSTACVANILVLSACLDHRLAAETTDAEGLTTGLLTSSLVEAIQGFTHPRRLTLSGLASRLGRSEQVPVITSSREIDRRSFFFGPEIFEVPWLVVGLGLGVLVLGLLVLVLGLLVLVYRSWEKRNVPLFPSCPPNRLGLS